jgi:hypothetical protein
VLPVFVDSFVDTWLLEFCLHIKVTELVKRDMTEISRDNAIEDFDFEELLCVDGSRVTEKDTNNAILA